MKRFFSPISRFNRLWTFRACGIAPLIALLLFSRPCSALQEPYTTYPYKPLPPLEIKKTDGEIFDLKKNLNPNGVMVVTLRMDCQYCWEALKGLFVWLGGMEPERKPSVWVWVEPEYSAWPWNLIGDFLGGAKFLVVTPQELSSKLKSEINPLILVLDGYGRIYRSYEGFSESILDSWTKDMLGIRAPIERSNNPQR